MARNKDFYKDLPGCVCAMLDRLENKYGSEPWFGSAWDDYRDHVIETNMDTVKMPGFVFNEYISEDGDE